MPTQNAYSPEVVQLEGGLDYVTPRPTAPPGALIDCYNFEVADRLGYKRDDGCEPFDGRPSISSCYNSLYVITVASATGANTNTWLCTTSNDINNAFATITSVSGNNLTVFVFDIYKFYQVYSGLATTLYSAGSGITFTVVSAISPYIFNGYDTISQAISNIVTNYATAYSRVHMAALPAVESGTTYYNPPAGMHWFNNQHYLVRDLPSILFDTGTKQIYPNDILKNTGSAVDILVRDVQLISGSWTGGNAVGKILYTTTSSDSYTPTGYFGHSTGAADVYPFTAVADLTTLDLVRGATTTASVVRFRTNVSGTIPSTWWAGLAVSHSYNQSLSVGNSGTSQDYQDIEMGYTFPFNNGTSNGPPTVPGRNASPVPAAIQTTTSFADASGAADTGVTVASPGSLVFNSTPTGFQWSYNAGTNHHPEANLTSQNDSKWIRWTVSNTLNAAGIPLILSGFSFNGIPTDAVITGVSVTGAAYMTNSGVGVSQHVCAVSAYFPTQTNTPTIKQSAVITSTAQVATQSFTLGNSGDTWGVGAITPANINNLNVALYPLCTTAGTIAIDFHIDYLQVTVHFQKSSSVYYFYNGTDDVQAIVTNAYIDPLTGGTWAGGTATGVMQVTQVQPYSTSVRSQITSNDAIRTAPAGAGSLLATVTGNMTFAGLPSLSMCQAQSSQYEMIDANFYENKDWSAIYGVSGAGRAFVYDTFYFRYIYTGLSDTLDLPRHLAFHNFHLCLGYSAGSLLTSAAGLPEDFNGLDGAADFGTGDAVVGLLRLSGTSLGVFCRKSIQALNGTGNDNFSMSVLSPYEGAIEYTVVDCGKPVYTSYRGISTLDQTNAYGNFLGSRLSANITPWLLPRLTQQVPLITVDSTNPSTYIFPNAGIQGPLFAMPVRSKNQYKLWFKDGYCLTMTLMGTDFKPVFTTQQINFGTAAAPDYLIPLAHSSGTDDKGLDRNHLSYYNSLTGRSTTFNATKNYVWELNRGWGWGKAPIYGWFTTTHNFYDNPLQIDNVRKIRLHGQSNGAATLKVDVSSNYRATSFKFGNLYGRTADNSPSQDISLPANGLNNSPATLSSDFQPLTNIASVAKRGRSFSMQFSTNPSTVEPPSVCQELLIQITEDKADLL
jgi:hypothetical protein